jgi:hypothetical protein
LQSARYVSTTSLNDFLSLATVFPSNDIRTFAPASSRSRSYGTKMNQQVLDVHPAQVGRPRAPSHGVERPFVPAQLEMIAFFAIAVKAIRKAPTS